MHAGRGRCACVLVVLLIFAAPPARGQASVSGRIVDENGLPVGAARVEVRGGSETAAIASSDSVGKFNFELRAAGDYAVHAECHGFFVLDESVHLETGSNHLTITLNHITENVESVEVVASPSPIDRTATADQQQLTSVEILEVPYPAPQDFRSALPLFQGIIQDNAGRLHFNGGSADQAGLKLDGFNIADPATGTFEARISIDAVRSLDLESSRFSAGNGTGTAAALDLKSGMGDDRLQFSGTNFFPGVTTQRGLFINKWTPRLTLSGPLVRGRAWFFNAFDAFYDVNVVRELPPGQDRSRGLTASNLSRFQINITPSQILTGSVLINYIDARYSGLSFLDPMETTTNDRSRFTMAALKHQVYFQGGTLAEFGIAGSGETDRNSPQGDRLYQIRPAGRAGNYFADRKTRTNRQQAIARLFLPAVKARGSHRFELGFDVQRAGFGQSAVRQPYEILREDGTVARRVAFLGAGVLHETDVTPAAYVQDRWSLRDNAVLESGIRLEHDGLLGRTALGPRVSLALSPGWLHGAKVSSGWGIFQDPLTLGTLAQAQDQTSVATFFSTGYVIEPRSTSTVFRLPGRSLRIPMARVFSVTLERKLPLQFFGKAGYTRRVGRDGLTFYHQREGIEAAPRQVVYSLCNCRNDRYDAVEVSLRRTFAGGFEWFGGYTYSRARSDAVVQYSLEQPIYAPQGPGPFEWDTPHRFLTWGWAPVPARLLPRWLRSLLRQTSVAYLAEARTGFPFSAVDEEGFLAGRPNARRFPAYFDINLHFERKFRVMHTLWAWRFGFNNITNNGNPNVVNNNVSSKQFLTYGRGQPRAFSVRLRFLGRK